MVEVYDQERKDPIANTWLFVSRDHNGEPVLVLDNIEVNNKYKDVVVNTAIRDNIFKFVTDYAKQCNIPKVGLGMVGTNDIDWDSLDKMVVAQVNKVGGYLKKYTSNAGDRAGRYYLEAYNAQTLGEVYNAERETKLESQAERREGIINVFDLESGKQESFVNTSANLVSLAQRRNISLEAIERDLNEIENRAFSPNIADSAEDILADFATGEGVNFLFLENNKLVGYLKSLRADQFEPLVDHAEYDANENTLYIESVAGKTNSYQALNELKELALEKGYQKLALHGISPRLNKILHRFGFETKAVTDDWAGEEAEYMELVLE